MPDLLTDVQLRGLTEHKYSSAGSSILEPYMQIFWKWLVEQIPRTWAPNALTLAGLIINIVTTSILILYSPDAKSEVPSSALFLSGVGLFVYQSLDAIDGKQARRTNNSSPLGELFDHGCDAVSTVFVALGTSITIGLGDVPSMMFLQCFAGVFIFYAAHWQTYVSGTLKFGRFDVTEAQFMVIGLYFVTSVVGVGFWSNTIPLVGLQLKVFMCYGSLVFMGYSLHSYFSVIFMEGGSGKNGSTIAGTSVLSPMIPAVMFIVAAVMIWKKSAHQLFELHPCLYILSFGLAISKITNKLVIAHMTKSEMPKNDSILLGPGLLLLNQYADYAVSEHAVLWICAVWTLYDLMTFSVRVCNEICNYLNIFCFKIKEVKPRRRTSIGKSPSQEKIENGSKTPEKPAADDSGYTSPITRSQTQRKED